MRRRVLKALTGLGIGTAVFQRAVAAEAKDKHEITAEMLQRRSGSQELSSTKMTARRSPKLSKAISTKSPLCAKSTSHTTFLRHLRFMPRHARPVPLFAATRFIRSTAASGQNDEDLAFMPRYELSALLRAGRLRRSN